MKHLQPYVLHSSKTSSIDSYRTTKTPTITNNSDDDENDIDTALVNDNDSYDR
jgi:beta-lactamase superfamily II metal-dependent hydrolase